MTTVLITGAAGFLGSKFLDHYMMSPEDDYDIWPMDIKPGPNRVAMDYQDLGLWLEDFDVPVDIAYHFAAPVGGREKIEGDPLYNADSLRLDSLFFRWAVKHAKTVVYPSSSAVYGTISQGENAGPLHEDYFHPGHDVWEAPDEMYGFTKLAGERLAWSAAKYGLNTLCIRPFSGYGEGQSFDYPVPSIARRALRGENPLNVWGPGTQTRDFIHVSDLVAATLARLRSPIEGYAALNLGSGKQTSFNEVAKICAELCDYEPIIQNLMDKPVGVTHRFAGTDEMFKHYKPRVDLREGLTRVLRAIRSSEDEAVEETLHAEDRSGS